MYVITLKMELDNNNSVSSEECLILSSSSTPSIPSMETEPLKRSASQVGLSKAESVSKINKV